MLRHKGSANLYAMTQGKSQKKKITSAKPVCDDTREVWKKDPSPILYAMTQGKRQRKNCKSKPVCYDTRKASKKKLQVQTCMLWHKESVKEKTASPNLYAMTQGRL